MVSILVSNYNYGRYIGDSIQSALDQTYPNIELIVCDDGSTDDSVGIIEEYQRNNPRMRLIRKENGGQASGFNAAFAASSPPWLGSGRAVWFVSAVANYYAAQHNATNYHLSSAGTARFNAFFQRHLAHSLQRPPRLAQWLAAQQTGQRRRLRLIPSASPEVARTLDRGGLRERVSFLAAAAAG